MPMFRLALIVTIFSAIIYSYSHKHHQNIADSDEPNPASFIWYKLTSKKVEWPSLPETPPSYTDIPKLPDIVEGDDILTTYINHSTFLIQTGGKNILTDPIWSDYTGPFSKVSIKRSVYPGIKIEQLPKINFILISHNHYDHLDLPTIEKLTQHHKPKIIMGLGVAKYIDYCKDNKDKCFEVDWWTRIKISGSKVELHFVPAHHWSGRYIFDRDHSLWGGFVINNGKDNIYFAGDTAFADGEIFKSIHKRYGDFRLALLPIGDYRPEYLFTKFHTSPGEAVEIARLLNSKYSIPMHFDIFKLSGTGYNEPIYDLEQNLRSYTAPDFHIMYPGQSWSVPAIK